MVIANNLDTAERIVLPHKPKPAMKYKWYDYVIFIGILSVIGTALFWFLITMAILLFLD